MNQLTEALKDAGVPIPPVKYRIWNWLKDHPEKTKEEIKKGLGLGYEPAAERRALEENKVLKVYSDVSRHINPVTKAHYKVKRYSVTNKLEFEQPLRKPYKKRKPQGTEGVIGGTSKAPAQVVKDIAAALSKPEPTFNPGEFIRPLTLPETKALYVYLHGVFK